MSAKFVDALKGYEYFIDKRGKVSLEEINDFLKRHERNPISQRAYTHYRSLIRYGFKSYFPINQFDVTRTLGQLPIAPDRRRYEREKVQINAKVSSDGDTWILSKIIDKSLVGFGMHTVQKFPIKSGNPIWVRIEQYHDIPAMLIWKKTDNNRIRFGVRAIEFISRYRIPEKEIFVDRLAGKLIVRKISKGDISWKEVHNLISKIEKLIDASSGLLYYIGEMINIDVKITPAVISSIKFSSPGELIVIIDWRIIALILVLIKIIQFWKLEKDRLNEENRTMKLDNDMREIQVEFARKIIKSRKAIDLEIVKQLLDAIPNWVKKALNIDDLPSTLFEPGSLEKGILKEQLLPVAADLIAGDDPEIKVDVQEISSVEPEEK